MHYNVIDLSTQRIENYEPMGTKSKFWFTDCQTREQYLFKSIHTNDKQGNPMIRCGEDWAEKVACELARKLGIPHAEYELATYRGESGTVSRKFIDEGNDLHFGNQLIEYVMNAASVDLEPGQRSQKINRVATILANLVKHPPVGFQKTESVNDALGVFIGYLMFDCLISNQDRHNENWGVISIDGELYLAPSFDHGASLGRNEPNDKMIERLTTRDKNRQIPTYVSKSKSFFYHRDRRLKTIEAFIILGYHDPMAAIAWLNKLEELSFNDIHDIVSKVPGSIMSDTQKQFSSRLIIANQVRMLSYMYLFQDS